MRMGQDPRAILANAEKLFSAEAVAAALDRMATEIAASLGDADPVVLAAMNGGAFAAVELCRRFRFPYEFDYVHATRYGESVTGGALEWRVDADSALRGRAVLLVDDVLDRGITLAALQSRLAAIGAARWETAVLVRKHLPDASGRPPVDYVGLEAGDRYLFGCGMDYAGYWRGLPEIYAL
jgi:hypoxanthine phosphoribosyltransferase